MNVTEWSRVRDSILNSEETFGRAPTKEAAAENQGSGIGENQAKGVDFVHSTHFWRA